MTFIAACATDDGLLLVDRDFGDSDGYDLYSVEPDGFTFLKRIENTRRNDDEHTPDGSAAKAGGIGKLLREHGADVMLANKIGQNITRMRKGFVPVVSRDRDVHRALENLSRIHDDIVEQIGGSEKSHFILQKDSSGSPS